MRKSSGESSSAGKSSSTESTFVRVLNLMDSDAERVRYLLRMKNGHRGHDVTYKKSDRSAVQLRNEGNFKLQNDPDEALILYTKSIAMSPPQSVALAMAHANRSVVLNKLINYNEAIVENQRALAAGYPDNLRHKLYNRQGLCYYKLQQFGKAIKCYKMALHYLEEFSELSIPDKEKLQNEITLCLESISIKHKGEKEEELEDLTQDENIGVKSSFPKGVPTIKKKNPEIPTAADCIALKYDKHLGRHFIATRDIQIGEVLIVEEPYCTFPFPYTTFTHCNHCYKRCVTLQPCKTCNWFLVCSASCMEKSKRYHELECHLMPGILEEDKNPYKGLLARAAITFAGRENLKEYFEKYPVVTLAQSTKNKNKLSDKERRIAGFNGTGKFISSDLEAITHIAHHEPATKDERNQNCGLSSKVMVAAKLNKHKYSYEIGSFVVKFYNSLNYNCVATIEFHEKGFNFVPLAASLYPTFSLLNSACNPRAFYHFYGRTIVVRAGKTIKEGTQVCMNFNKPFGIMPRAERQKYLLKSWNFVCRCEACENHWPCQENLPENPMFELPKERALAKLIQASFQKLLDIPKCANFFVWTVTDKNIQLFKNYMILLEKTGKTLCRNYYLVAESLRGYYNKLGNHVSDNDVADNEESLTDSDESSDEEQKEPSAEETMTVDEGKVSENTLENLPEEVDNGTEESSSEEEEAAAAQAPHGFPLDGDSYNDLLTVFEMAKNFLENHPKDSDGEYIFDCADESSDSSE